MVISKRYALLCSHEHKPSAEFKQESFNLLNKRLFKITFKERLVLGSPKNSKT